MGRKSHFEGGNGLVATREINCKARGDVLEGEGVDQADVGGNLQWGYKWLTLHTVTVSCAP